MNTIGTLSFLDIYIEALLHIYMMENMKQTQVIDVNHRDQNVGMYIFWFNAVIVQPEFRMQIKNFSGRQGFS